MHYYMNQHFTKSVDQMRKGTNDKIEWSEL